MSSYDKDIGDVASIDAWEFDYKSGATCSLLRLSPTAKGNKGLSGLNK